MSSWLLIAIANSAPTAQSKRAMTIDDAIDLVQVSSPRISPDGRRVLYTVSELGKWKDNKRVTSIWIADADGSNARRFLGNEKPRKGHFTANLNLIVKPLPRGLTLRQWFFAGQSAAMQYVGKTSTISNNGTPGLHYRSTKVMKAGTVPLLTEIYAFVYQGRIFDFTYTSGAADAQSYLPTFTASAGSIRFGTP